MRIAPHAPLHMQQQQWGVSATYPSPAFAQLRFSAVETRWSCGEFRGLASTIEAH